MVSGPLPQVGATAVLAGMAGFRSAYREMVAGLNDINRVTLRMSSESAGAWADLASASNRGQSSVVRSLGLIATAVAAVVTAFRGLRLGAEFESTMTRVSVLSQGTDAEMAQLGDTARTLAAVWGRSMNEIADATVNLSRAGVKIDDIRNGALRTVLVLESVAAGELSLARASELVAQGMTTFGIAAGNSDRIARALAGTANESTATFEEVANAVQIAGSTIQAVGGEVEDLGAFIGILADRSIRGTNAGTSLRGMFQALINPSKEALEVMKQYNISLFDAQGRTIGARNFLLQLSQAFSDTAIAQGKLTQADRAYALGSIFRTRTFNSAIALANSGTDAYDKFMEAIANTDPVAQAERQLSTLQGRVGQFKGTLEGLVVTILNGVNPGLASMTNTVTGLLAALDVNLLQSFGEALGAAFAGEGLGQLGNIIRDQLGPAMEVAFDGVLLIMNTLGRFIGENVLPGLLGVVRAVNDVVAAQGGWQAVIARVALGVVSALDVIQGVFNVIVSAATAAINVFSKTATGVDLISAAIQGIPIAAVIALAPIFLALVAPLALLVARAIAVSVALGAITRAAQFVGATALPALRPFIDMLITNLPTAVRVAQVALVGLAAFMVGRVVIAAALAGASFLSMAAAATLAGLRTAAAFAGAAAGAIASAVSIGAAAVIAVGGWLAGLPALIVGLASSAVAFGRMSVAAIAAGAASAVAAVRATAGWLASLPAMGAAMIVAAGNMVAMAVQGVKTAASMVAAAVATSVAWLGTALPAVVAAAAGIVAAILAVAVPLAPLIAAMAAVVVAWNQNWFGMQGIVAKALKVITDNIRLFIFFLGKTPLLGPLIDATVGAFDAIAPVISNFAAGTTGAVQGAVADIRAAGETAIAGIGAQITGAVGKLGGAITSAMDEIDRTVFGGISQRLESLNVKTSADLEAWVQSQLDALKISTESSEQNKLDVANWAADITESIEEARAAWDVYQEEQRRIGGGGAPSQPTIPEPPDELGFPGGDGGSGGKDKKPTEADKLKELIRLVGVLLADLPLMNRELAEFIAKIAVDEPARLLPMVRAVRDQKETISEMVVARRDLLGVEIELAQVGENIARNEREQQRLDLQARQATLDMDIQLLQLRGQLLAVDQQIWPITDRIREIDREITDLQRDSLRLAQERAQVELALLPFKRALEDIDKRVSDTQKENLDLTQERLRVEQFLVQFHRAIEDIEKRIGAAQRENLAVALAVVQAQLQILPALQQVEALDRQISVIQRENLVLARDELLLQQAMIPARRAVADLEQQINDIVNERQRLLSRREELGAEGIVTDLRGQLDAVTEELDTAWQSFVAGGMDASQIISLEGVRQDLETQLAGAEKNLKAITDQQRETARLNEIQQIGLKLQQQDILDTLEPMERQLLLLQRQQEDEKIRADIVVNAYEQQRRALEATVEATQTYIQMLQDETALQKARADVVVAGLNQERALIEDLIAPYTDYLDNLIRQQEDYTLRNDIVRNGLELERRRIEELAQPLRDKLAAIEREREEYGLRNTVVISGLQIERANLEALMRPLEDKRLAIEREQRQVQALQDAIKIQYEQQKLQLEKSIVDEKLRQMALQDTEAAMRKTYNTLIERFLEAMRQSGAFTLEESAEVLKRLGLWDEQSAKLGETIAQFTRLDEEARRVRKSIDDIPKSVEIVITTVHRDRNEGSATEDTGQAAPPGSDGQQSFATGGIAWTRRWAQVAENGPEFIIPFSQARTPANVTRMASGGGGGGRVTNNYYSYDFQANYAETQAPITLAHDTRAVIALTQR